MLAFTWSCVCEQARHRKQKIFLRTLRFAAFKCFCQCVILPFCRLLVCVPARVIASAASLCIACVLVRYMFPCLIPHRNALHSRFESFASGPLGLKSLSLRGNALGESFARGRARALYTNTSLESLMLASNNINDDGVAALVPALRDNRTLRALSLSSNQLTSVR